MENRPGARPTGTKKSQKLKRPPTIKSMHLMALPLLVLLIKLVIMSNTPSFGWLGADGESYIGGVYGLVDQGYFSDKPSLSYWPAGYPIIIWLLTKITSTQAIWLLFFVQSAFFSAATYYFMKQVCKTKLASIHHLISIVLLFNPTLSLSSLVVGYESPIASCMLIIAGLILKSLILEEKSEILPQIIGVGFFSALATFMQPRWILTSAIIAVAWALMQKSKKIQVFILVGVTGLMLIAPAALIQRNIESIGKAVVSTNLGVTMQLGAGPSTSGGYQHTGANVPCETQTHDAAPSDSQLVKCVLIWYLNNPLKLTPLIIKKSFYFWSPWSGPLSNGTSARNPWLNIAPTKAIAEGSISGYNLVYGRMGKAISFMWVLVLLTLLFVGFFWLKSLGALYSNFAWIVFLPILVSWVVSIGTIGDNRFRIPTMPLSLFLQVAGFYAIQKKLFKKAPIKK